MGYETYTNYEMELYPMFMGYKANSNYETSTECGFFFFGNSGLAQFPGVQFTQNSDVHHPKKYGVYQNNFTITMGGGNFEPFPVDWVVYLIEF